MICGNGAVGAADLPQSHLGGIQDKLQ